MTRDELLSRISINPDVCGGQPCVRGHRIWVSLVLDLLASGSSVHDILDNYPGLEEADVLACIAYGAEMSRERHDDIRVESASDRKFTNAASRLSEPAFHEVWSNPDDAAYDKA